MQDELKVAEAFDRLKALGISYDMILPEGLVNEYSNFLEQNVKSDF